MQIFTWRHPIGDDTFRIVFIDTPEAWCAIVNLQHTSGEEAKEKTEIRYGMHSMYERAMEEEWRHRLIELFPSFAQWRVSLIEEELTERERLLAGLSLGISWMNEFSTKHFEPRHWQNMDEVIF